MGKRVGPRRLKIGHSIYSVKRVPLDDAYGETDVRDLTIKIAPGLAGATAAHTLVHEALHALFAASGLSGDPQIARLEERIVSGLEAPLAAMIADNPALIKYVTEELSS